MGIGPGPRTFPDLKGQAPLRLRAFLYLVIYLLLFLTSKVRLHCDRAPGSGRWKPTSMLFLTSKVRLHCDRSTSVCGGATVRAFPDLKGQAPLRPVTLQAQGWTRPLFLTSKVRLHCDLPLCGFQDAVADLFLTSKVRLHCDWPAPPRPPRDAALFLTSKVRLHCDTGKQVSVRMRA